MGRKSTKGKITAKRVQATENKPVSVIDHKPEVDDDAWDDNCLTERQRRFVEAYTGPAGGNATKAAEMAGYNAENRITLAQTGSENLRKPYVQEAIAHALAKKRQTPAWAHDRLVEIAASSMRNFVDISDDGKMTVNWKKARDYAAIGQIAEVTEDVLPGSGGGEDVIRRKFKLHNPRQALEVLLKLSGTLVERHSVQLDFTKLSDDDLQRLLEIHDKAIGGRFTQPAGGN